MGDWVLARISPSLSARNEVPSTSYWQDRAGGRRNVRGPTANACGCGVRRVTIRNARDAGRIGRCNIVLRRSCPQTWEGLQALGGGGRGFEQLPDCRQRMDEALAVGQQPGSSSPGDPKVAAASIHSVGKKLSQLGGSAGFGKERNPALCFTTFIVADGGIGGGDHGRGRGGGGDGDGDGGNGEDGFENEDGRHAPSGLLATFGFLLASRQGLRPWVLCLSAASLGFLLSGSMVWGGFHDLALALTASSFSKPRRLADGTSGSENGDDVSNPQTERNLVGAIWEVQGSKWRRFVLDLKKDDFVLDVVKPNETEAESYELACQEDREHELVKGGIDREYAMLRSRMADEAEKCESEGSPVQDSGLQTPNGSSTLVLPVGEDELRKSDINNAVEQVRDQIEEYSSRIERTQPVVESLERRFKEVVGRCGALVKQVMLPEGYPRSVTDDYTEFTLWRMGQIIASQINGVLTTQALLYAIGLGKGAIPTAAAINWVLRDGIGYLSKIMLSKYGRHFDVHPKGWRMLSDLLENASYGLELLTPVFPHLFVYLGAAAGAGRSASGMIQAATKSCFNAGFAAQRNFAELVAKGEAQGMVSKSMGIALGIAISGYVGSSGPRLLATFAVVTALHMFFNLKSYQAVQLRTLNLYRGSLVLSEYLRSGSVPSVREVNAEEPIFPRIGVLHLRLKGQQEGLNTLSESSKRDAESIDHNLELGSMLGSLIHTREEAEALLPLYEKEQYMLARRGDRLLVVLRESVTPRDMLRALFQVTIMYNLQNQNRFAAGTIPGDCVKGGVLEVSHRIMAEEFQRMQQNLSAVGWVSEGLVARPSPNRLLTVAMKAE